MAGDSLSRSGLDVLAWTLGSHPQGLLAAQVYITVFNTRHIGMQLVQDLHHFIGLILTFGQVVPIQR